MAVLTPPEDELRAGEDERGASLARPSNLDSRPTQGDIEGGINEAENFANDPANATGDDQSGGTATKTGGSTGSAGEAKADPISRLQDKTADAKAAGGGGFRGAGAKLGSMAAGAGSFIGKNKKSFSVGAIIGTLLISAGVGFLAFLPLKIESMMKNIFKDYVGNRVERSVERRALRMMSKYAITGERSAVITGSPLADLFSTWKSNRFEAKLSERSKITFGPRSGDVGVKITFEDGTTREFRNSSELKDFFNGKTKINGQIDPYSTTFKEAFADSTKWRSVLKRRQIRILQATRYGVSRWRKKMDAKDSETAKADLDTDLKETTKASYGSKVSKAVACFFGDTNSCPDEQNRTAGDNAPDPDGPARAGDTVGAAEDALADGVDIKDVESKTIEKLGVKGALKESLPIIGWIDFGARMDKLVHDNTTEKVIDDLRKAQYANAFASWLIISDQIKNGKTVTGEAVNAAMLKLDGSEKSSASHRIYSNDTTGGEKIDNSRLFGHTNLDAMRQTYFALTLGENGPYHIAMNLYLHTIGKLFDLLGGAVGWIISKVPGVSNLSEFVGKFVMKGFMALLSPVVTGTEAGSSLMNVVDAGGDVTGNDLAESMGGQELTTAQIQEQQTAIAKEDADYARSKGLWYRLTSPDYRYSASTQIAVNMPASTKGAITDGANSMIAAIASPMTAFNNLFAHPLALSFSPAYADAVTPDPYGLATMGFTEAQLDADVDEVALKAAADRAIKRDPKVKRADGSTNTMLMLTQDCDADPANPTPASSQCKLDLETIKTLIPNYTNDDDGGVSSVTSGSAPTTTSQAVPSGDLKALALQMLAIPSIRYWTNNGVNTRDVVVALSQGLPAYTTCANATNKTADLNPNILKFIIEASASTNIMVNALTDKCHTDGSNHYSGQAVDLDLNNSGPLSILNPIAAKYGGTKNSETNHHHYDFPK